MSTVFIVDNSVRDVERFRNLFAAEGLEVTSAASGEEAQTVLANASRGFDAAFILWDLPGAISGFDLMAMCRGRWPEMPIVVMCSALDAAMATQAYAFGARDFLEKPLDADRIRSCVRSLLVEQHSTPPLVAELRKQILGDSQSLLAMLAQVAKAIPHADSRILLIGESGTGKELIARAIHRLGPNSRDPLVAVNISEVPSTLVESVLFGHERGAFTGATDRHTGLLEEAKEGMVFLDEVGDLDLLLQGKLLRLIQENVFRRLKGTQPLRFRARLVCATNINLAEAVNKGTFRRDLFHRIAEITIQVPALRHRRGDLEVLLKHFLKQHGGDRPTRLARETLAILRSYPFLGNVRELENLVRSALIDASDQGVILPHHLPLQNMGTLLASNGGGSHEPPNPQSTSRHLPPHVEQLIEQLLGLVPANWQKLPYREAVNSYIQAFDRVYLKHKLEQCRYNITQAAKESGVDTKTFRKRWKECGLPSLAADEAEKESQNE